MRIPSPVTPEHIGYAVIRLAEIEATKHHGGKRGQQLVDMRRKQKRHINELIEAFEGQAARGRDIDGGSTAEDLVAAKNNFNENIART
jgi:hypothetical protein